MEVEQEEKESKASLDYKTSKKSQINLQIGLIRSPGAGSKSILQEHK